MDIFLIHRKSTRHLYLCEYCCTTPHLRKGPTLRPYSDAMLFDKCWQRGSIFIIVSFLSLFRLRSLDAVWVWVSENDTNQYLQRPPLDHRNVPSHTWFAHLVSCADDVFIQALRLFTGQIMCVNVRLTRDKKAQNNCLSVSVNDVFLKKCDLLKLHGVLQRADR